MSNTRFAIELLKILLGSPAATLVISITFLLLFRKELKVLIGRIAAPQISGSETVTSHAEQCLADKETWGINETLLQSYRSIFVSSQSFLLAVGAIVSGKSPMVLYVIAAISLVMIWTIWFPVVRARHRIVDYHKYGSALSESKRSELCSEKQYVHDIVLRKKANELFGIRSNWRPTRKRLDILMPALISFVWLVLIAYEVSHA